jgi:hypothetical protein
MPLPLLALALAPAAGTIGTVAAVTLKARILSLLGNFGLAFIARFWDEIQQEINDYFLSEDFRSYLLEKIQPYIIDYVYERTGLRLDPDDPFSKVSISAAISAKVGITITDITDGNQTLRDLGDAAAQLINARTGTTLPALNFSDATQMRAAMRDEITQQAINAMAGQISLLDDATIAIIKQAALIDAAGLPPPTATPSKRQLAARAAQRRYAAAQKRNNFYPRYVYIEPEPPAP